MGTTLTGTTPQDTYDSLIKVTDNGPLSGSLKTLTDGLGNDSALALSTGGASVTGTLAVSGNSTFDTTTLVVDAAGDRVILGAAAALEGDTIEIHAKSNSGAISLFGRASDNGSVISFRSNGATTQKARIYGSDAGLGFATGTTERVLIDSSGNVGIGTSSPQSRLSVQTNTVYAAQFTTSIGTATTTRISIGGFAGIAPEVAGDVAIGAAVNHGANSESALVFYTNTGSGLTEKGRFLAGGGLTFNGDTAAANALDDYEEGTWTISVAFGGASVGVTYTANTGTYTKIGRQVTVNGFMQLSNKGSSTGAAAITGLPFAVANTTGNYSAASLAYITNITFADTLQGYPELAQTQITLIETTNAGVRSSLTDADFANNSELMISFTYFV